MIRNLFRPDSPLMVIMSHITDCIFLSLFYFLGSFPVITLGASTAALYDAMYRGCRQGDKHPWTRFFKTFRLSFKGSLLPNLLFLGLLAADGWAMIRVWNAAVAGSVSWMAFSAAALLGAFVLGILSILFPMLSRFENSTGALLKNTLFLALANAPRTVLLGILNAGSLLLCLRFIVPVFFLPGLASLLSSWLIEPMFRPYMPAEEEIPTL